jgi:glutamate synthase (NADPH/NADH) large chain
LPKSMPKVVYSASSWSLCEYMTGGTVIILGPTGQNFAAGMSGGLAFVFDKDKLFANRCNKEMVDLEGLTSDDEAILKGMITKHLNATNSEVARGILDNWSGELENLVKVYPTDYKRILAKINAETASKAA